MGGGGPPPPPPPHTHTHIGQPCIKVWKTSGYDDLPERSNDVIFSKNSGLGSCRAIPLEHLIIVASNYNRIKV